MSLKLANASSMGDFNNMIAATGLVDVGFVGNRFTWSNNKMILAYVAVRLDRALINPQWVMQFKDATLHILARHSSDHSPILLSAGSSPAPKIIPFKFEEMWIQHLSFMKVVEDSWNRQGEILSLSYFRN